MLKTLLKFKSKTQKQHIIFSIYIIFITITSSNSSTISNTSNEINISKSISYGNYLTDNNGFTLYIFEQDKPYKSTCYYICEIYWTPYYVNNGEIPKAGTGVIKSMLNVSKRIDGKYIVTYNGWPLYYNNEEIVSKNNFVSRQGKSSAGGYWFILQPSGNVNYSSISNVPNLDKGNTLEITTSSVFGQYITDKSGATLYVYNTDSFLKSNCYTICSINWPPYIIDNNEFPTFGKGIDSTLVYFTTRIDGKRIVTYNGMPLYYYKEDENKVNTIKGQNHATQWWILKQDGTINKTKDPSFTNTISSNWLVFNYSFSAIAIFIYFII